ncbi:MAG: ATP-binding protein [Myxococcota bacterium]
MIEGGRGRRASSRRESVAVAGDPGPRRPASHACSLAFPLACSLLLALLWLTSCRPVVREASDPDPGLQRDRTSHAEMQGGVISLRSLEAHVGPAERPPADDEAGWETRALPDFWSRRVLGERDDVWYRAEFHLEAPPDELWALYLPRLRMNAAARVNGQSIGSGGRFGDRVTRNWNRPLYFTVPGAALRAGRNRIDLHLGTSRASDIRLVAVEVGPDRVLRPRYDARVIRQVDLRYLMVSLTLATALLIAVVAIRRPEIKGAVYFIGTMVCMAFAWSDGLIRDPPMPTLVWQWLNVVSYLLGFVCVVAGTNRALEVEAPWTERLAWGLLVVVGALVPVHPYYFVTINIGILSLGVATLGHAVYRIFTALRRGSLRHGRVLLSLGLVLIGLTLHDVQSGFTGLALPYAPLTTFVPLVMVFFTTWMLMGYVLRALSSSEQLAESLNERVAEARLELQRNYDRLREMERGQLIARERDRMLREMHDGIGGQLISALALLERKPSDSGAAGETLREALGDMRQMLDSVSNTDDLPSLLGSMRSRLERRLSRHGLRFDWRVCELPELRGLGPGGMRHVMRIVQEAISNVIEHAGAEVIRIETEVAPGPDGRPGVRLEIEDDGCGLSDGAESYPGRGLPNMRSRAADLGGHIEIGPGARGTRVRLWLPMEAPTTAGAPTP